MDHIRCNDVRSCMAAGLSRRLEALRRVGEHTGAPALGGAVEHVGAKPAYDPEGPMIAVIFPFGIFIVTSWSAWLDPYQKLKEIVSTTGVSPAREAWVSVSTFSPRVTACRRLYGADDVSDAGLCKPSTSAGRRPARTARP